MTNHTGIVIWVDCTQEGLDINEERRLDINQTTTYYMKPGIVTEWATDEANYPIGSWSTAVYNLEQCDVHNDPWTAGKGFSVSRGVKEGIKTEGKGKDR